MNGFTSGTQALQGRRVNHDPKPWEDVSGAPGCERFPWEVDYSHYRPRPEYDVLDNPILAAYRQLGVRRARVFRTWAQTTMHKWTWERFDFTPTPEQIEHARRVLTKLASLE